AETDPAPAQQSPVPSQEQSSRSFLRPYSRPENAPANRRPAADPPSHRERATYSVPGSSQTPATPRGLARVLPLRSQAASVQPFPPVLERPVQAPPRVQSTPLPLPYSIRSSVSSLCLVDRSSKILPAVSISVNWIFCHHAQALHCNPRPPHRFCPFSLLGTWLRWHQHGRAPRSRRGQLRQLLSFLRQQ